MNECKIIAVANQKGGTAKTTTACNLSAALAESGCKVLAVDMDPQKNLSMSFGIDKADQLDFPMHDLLAVIMEGGVVPDKCEYILNMGKAHLIPTDHNLTKTETSLRNEPGGERILSELLDPLRIDYDYIVIDTSPSIGMLTKNALAACDSVIIPVSPQLWSATGLTDLLQTVYKIKRKINPNIRIEGILLTMCDERTRLYRDAKALLEEFCDGTIRIFNTRIPSTVSVGEANYNSVSISAFDAKSKAAIAYNELAKEVIGNA